MNPFEHNEPTQWFGKNLISGFLGRKNSYKSSSSYLNMKDKQIKKRRQKNKMAYKSRRYNRIRKNNLHCKFYPI